MRISKTQHLFDIFSMSSSEQKLKKQFSSFLVQKTKEVIIIIITLLHDAHFEMHGDMKKSRDARL